LDQQAITADPWLGAIEWKGAGPDEPTRFPLVEINDVFNRFTVAEGKEWPLTAERVVRAYVGRCGGRGGVPFLLAKMRRFEREDAVEYDRVAATLDGPPPPDPDVTEEVWRSSLGPLQLRKETLGRRLQLRRDALNAFEAKLAELIPAALGDRGVLESNLHAWLLLEDPPEARVAAGRRRLDEIDRLINVPGDDEARVESLRAERAALLPSIEKTVEDLRSLAKGNAAYTAANAFAGDHHWTEAVLRLALVYGGPEGKALADAIADVMAEALATSAVTWWHLLLTILPDSIGRERAMQS
jgi:hypothetical protein